MEVSMEYFNYQQGVLHVERIPVQEIAEHYGTPCYIYSRAALENHWQAFHRALTDYPHRICYAVKANPNLAILNCLARLGSGFDIVSVGELERVIRAGGDPHNIVFSGVGKRVDEMQRALEVGIHCFNVESSAELARLNNVAARLNTQAPAALRVNPAVDAGTHPYIATGLKENKFGIDADTAYTLYTSADYPHIRWVGIDCHIGSQITTIAPFEEALERLLPLVARLEQQGVSLSHLDIGGGLGIRYHCENPPEPDDYINRLKTLLTAAGFKGALFIEPGRAIVGNAGILLTRVEYLKHQGDKHFAIVDAAMNDLIRPALYSAYQNIIPVQQHACHNFYEYDIVGPVCESADFLGKERYLALQAGDLLAVCSAGAYGASMASTYNSRPRPAEVMVDGETVHCIYRRESVQDLFSREWMLPMAFT